MSSLYKRRSHAEADRGKKKFRNFSVLAAPCLFVGHAVPAVCDIVALPNSPESTPDVSYHLIGRIVRDAGGDLAIAQDHAPGNLYHLWFGPCFHLLQTPPTA